jgi:hypothetical protein
LDNPAICAKDFAPGVVFLYEEHKPMPTMTKILCLAAGLLALGLAPVSAQPAPPAEPLQASPPPGNFQQHLQRIVRYPGPDGAEAPALSKFSLDFPGGSPSQFVEAIQKAMGKPLNVIINQEDEDMAIPPLKMNDVVMPQLFTALEATSRKTVQISNGGFGNSYYQVTTSYGFNTSDNPVSDTSVWYFHVDRPAMRPAVSVQKSCQFYSLSDYLNHGFTVDDITTAIQTGWKLSGETNTPELNYHKETKLLIAYGDPSKLKTIDQVLQTLPSEKAVRTRQQSDQMAAEIQKLQEEVDQLKKAASSAGTGTPAEEKTGK